MSGQQSRQRCNYGSAHLSKVLLLFLLRELWPHGTVQPCQSLADIRDLLRCDLFDGPPLFIFERGEPRVDESPVREQSTGVYES